MAVVGAVPPGLDQSFPNALPGGAETQQELRAHGVGKEQAMAHRQRVGDLEVTQELRFQRRGWIVQRPGWVVWGLADARRRDGVPAEEVCAGDAGRPGAHAAGAWRLQGCRRMDLAGTGQRGLTGRSKGPSVSIQRRQHTRR